MLPPFAAPRHPGFSDYPPAAGSTPWELSDSDFLPEALLPFVPRSCGHRVQIPAAGIPPDTDPVSLIENSGTASLL